MIYTQRITKNRVLRIDFLLTKKTKLIYWKTRNRGKLASLDCIYIYIYNIILIDEKISPKLGTKQGCSFLPLLFSIVLEVIANTIAKGNKRHID